jgi:hypothetical protein
VNKDGISITRRKPKKLGETLVSETITIWSFIRTTYKVNAVLQTFIKYYVLFDFC